MSPTAAGTRLRDLNRSLAEVGMALPKEPTLFIKAPSAVCGPDDPIVRPRGAEKLDYEVELGVVLGRDASCDVVVAQNEVSRRHAEFVKTEFPEAWHEPILRDNAESLFPWPTPGSVGAVKPISTITG